MRFRFPLVVSSHGLRRVAFFALFLLPLLAATPVSAAVAPIVDPIANASVQEGNVYATTPTLSQGTAPVVWSLVEGPNGMTITTATGAVTWDAPSAVASPYTVTIRATNATGSDEVSWFLVVGNKATFVSLAPLLPPVGDQGAGDPGGPLPAVAADPVLRSGVAWATAYYYLTLEKARNDATATTSPAMQRSPYFARRNGGSLRIFHGLELLKGTGSCSLALSPDYATTTTAADVADAGTARFAAIAPFFLNKVALSKTGVFTSLYNNDLTSLKAWLAGTSTTKFGSPFVLGIPLFESLRDPANGGNPDLNANGIYDVANPLKEQLFGFHAVCVVGYDDVRHAFLAVNSWGPRWNGNGFVWLSYRFVRTCADEAWHGWYPTGKKLTDQYTMTYTRAGNSIDLPNLLVSQGNIVFTPLDPTSGTLVFDDTGIVIPKGQSGDSLKIARKPGRAFYDPIPRVISDGGFVSFYTEATIGQIRAVGYIISFVAVDATVGSMAARGYSTVVMSAGEDGTWADVAQALALGADPAYRFDRLSNNAPTAVLDTWVTAETVPAAHLNTAVTLTGVSLGGLYLPDYIVTLKMSSKPGLAPGTTYACLNRSDCTGGAFWTHRLVTATITGGRFTPDELSADLALGPVRATSTVLKDKVAGVTDIVRGDVAPGAVSAGGAIASLSATGGDLVPDSVEAGGAITALAAKSVTYRIAGTMLVAGGATGSGTKWVVGGAVGTSVTAQVLSSRFTSDTLALLAPANKYTPFISGTNPKILPSLRGIGSVTATSDIRGIFVAGATVGPDGRATALGDARVKKLTTKKTSSILGEYWSKKVPALVGNTTGFTQH
jgi:hypothetical protein